MPSERDELLNRVYARAGRLWWQRRVLSIAASAMVLAVGIGVPLLAAGGSHHTTHVASTPDGSTATTSPDGERTEPGGEPSGTTTTTTTMSKPGSTSRPAEHPATTAVYPVEPTNPIGGDPCRNNNGNSACGDFHWAHDPGPNAPLTFQITYSPEHPAAGQEVTFTVHVVDPDASPVSSCGDGYDDQPTFAAVGCVHTMECAANYGAWDVPAKQRGEATFTYKHAFNSAGEHRAEFHAQSMQGSKSNGQCASQPNPYASEGAGSVTVNVS